MKKSYPKFILWIIGILLALLTALVGLKIFAPEETWLCEDGQWVRHGNPSSEMPAEGCE